MSILRTTWAQTCSIVKRAVARGQERKQELPTSHMGMDEKAFAKGQSYLTLLVDLDRSTVEAISEGNDVAGAKSLFFPAFWIKERLTNVLRYCTNRITNGVAEGINCNIMATKRRNGGFRNVGNYKTTIYFYCAGLNLHKR
jgi:transposase